MELRDYLAQRVAGGTGVIFSGASNDHKVSFTSTVPPLPASAVGMPVQGSTHVSVGYTPTLGGMATPGQPSAGAHSKSADDW